MIQLRTESRDFLFCLKGKRMTLINESYTILNAIQVQTGPIITDKRQTERYQRDLSATQDGEEI